MSGGQSDLEEQFNIDTDAKTIKIKRFPVAQQVVQVHNSCNVKVTGLILREFPY